MAAAKAVLDISIVFNPIVHFEDWKGRYLPVSQHMRGTSFRLNACTCRSMYLWGCLIATAAATQTLLNHMNAEIPIATFDRMQLLPRQAVLYVYSA